MKESRTSATKNQLKRSKTTLDDRKRERERGGPDIDGRGGASRWCPVVLRLDYAAKIEILDSSEARARRRGSDWWLDSHCVGFCPFASPCLPPSIKDSISNGF